MNLSLSLIQILGVLFLAQGLVFAQGSTAYSGQSSPLELPDISVVVDMLAEFTDDGHSVVEEKLRIREAELVFSSYLNPSIRGDLVIAVEQQYEGRDVETEVHIEEAYVSFLDLPGGFQGILGRKFIGIGRLNPLHRHQWAFADTPLPLQNLFGEHSWFDDGVELSYLIPNPADVFLKVSVGVWNGNSIGHSHGHADENDHGSEDHGDHDDEDGHGHEDDDDHGHDEEGNHDDDHAHGGGEVIEWDGHVYTARIFSELPVNDQLRAQAGYSLVKDDHSRNTLHAADLVFLYERPFTFQKLKWHSEWFRMEDKELGSQPSGYFSALLWTLNKNWETGLRYDWTELLEHDHEEESAASVFLTYFLNESTFFRGQYQRKEHEDGDKENIFFLQFVWGFGPHSHRLSD